MISHNAYRSSNFNEFFQHPLEKRKEVSRKIISKYPDRIPILVDRSKESKQLPLIDRYKYLVPDDFTVGKFLVQLRSSMDLKSDQAIFLFVGNTLLPTGSMISLIYNKYKDEDGFLYIVYSGENAFGSS